ncbi:methyltransferase domain-containing protein [Nocardioides sp. BP30]|uniref:methyltransferase domain-containing protein n=1 Tax=Nocardioides sp. BP30 TaxID=3036374 RepID=UPI0024686590|nr:methyltransferase domain-containing protein [Nocardioides sp. BP30]WGL51826.1 methyltransferase domain-containing protein [Nocardioides sp. BP30]
MPSWDPQHYLTYADERGRPFVDLVARIGAVSPARVVDLGCGPGNMTRLLAQRWPGADVIGVDSSAEMVARARSDHPELRWIQADVRDWLEPADVLISNAMLQWVPDHLALLPALAALAGEWVAFQVPANFAEPSHTIPIELAASTEYVEHTAAVELPGSHDAATYLAVLRDDFEVDAWETTYLHVLAGEDAVFDWVSGTGLRPILQALPEDLRERFVEEVKVRLRAAYPARDGVVVMPFRRIFVVGRRR